MIIIINIGYVDLNRRKKKLRKNLNQMKNIANLLFTPEITTKSITKFHLRLYFEKNKLN